jgi:hypothetical protein
MQLVWSQPTFTDVTATRHEAFLGRYQDMLRSLGAWVDARGYRLVRLSSSDQAWVVEVEVGQPGDDLSREVFRLDDDALERLLQAARTDRDRFQRAG